ncbi:MAG: hypothetical protein DRI23_06740 [Candidatus Cloacimonadota bacterium]|nr:MAG: hypothetical protein DRI23_06740 [Candidatus Cloacimonadota bacterium]
MKKIIIIFLIVLPVLIFGQSITLNTVEMQGDGGNNDQNIIGGETVSVSVDYTTSNILVIGESGTHNDGTSSGRGYISIYCYQDDPPNPGSHATLGIYSVAISNYSDGGTGTNKTATFNFTVPESLPSSTVSVQIRFGMYGLDSTSPYPYVYGTQYQSYVTDTYSVCGSAGTPTSGWYEYLKYTADTETEDPTLDLPSSSSTIGQSFTVQYDQPEAAYSNTVKLTFTRTGGTAYTGDTHVLTVSSLTAGDDKTLTIDGEDLDSSSGVSLDSGGSALQNGRIYTVKIEYQDEAQNTAANDSNTNITYDNVTATPTLDLPDVNDFIVQNFTVQYDQSETAYTNTVKLTFTRTSGTSDPDSPHILIVDSEASGTNKTLSINGSDLDGSSGVSLSSGGNYLVNGTTYTVKIEYQDAYQNPVASDQNAGIKYDTSTLSPTFDLPATDTTFSQSFTVQYDQPEDAYASSVELKFSRTGGSSDAGSPHVLEVTSEALGTNIQLTINGSNLSSSTGISSLVSGTNSLVNGSVYTIEIKYQDEAQNTAASDENTSITYDTATETPTLDSPSANQSVGQNFTVQYDQPETAYTSTVKLTFTRTAGTADGNSPHILEVESEVSGDNKSLTINGADLGGSTGVSLSSGGNSLVDDAIYSVKIEYQDEAQNTAADDQNDGITYDTSGLLLVSGSDYNVGESFQPDTDNNAFFILELQKSTSGSNATVDVINFDLTGSFDNSDIDAIKIWRSSDNSFDSASDTHLITDSSAPFDPFEADFSPNELINTTKVYYFLTVDVSSTAGTGDNLGAQINAASDITCDISVSGTFPISGDDHPLPVTLSNFEVQMQGREPKLIWVTQSETNNAFWNIYRSDSGDLSQAFQMNTNNTISGQGTTSTPTDYIFIDQYPVEANTTYWYWLESIAYNGTSEIMGPVAITISYNGGSAIPEAPVVYGLQQNYPNPFNPSTSISFILPYSSKVELAIYNIKGEKVSTIYEGTVEAEIENTYTWNGLNKTGKLMPTGLYIFQLKTQEDNYYRKMNLIK